MTDDYECEGRMNIFEFLAKEPEANDSWNKWPERVGGMYGEINKQQGNIIYVND